MPEFLTAYDSEQLGKKEGAKTAGAKPEKSERKGSREEVKAKKRPVDQRKDESKRTALSVIITILIIILVIVVACIIVLKMMPDSIGAYYIQDFIDTVQGRIGIGNNT
jgi:lipopolysaccharide/colanic/teichoic acid biosynthesis glycosyltransferase